MKRDVDAMLRSLGDFTKGAGATVEELDAAELQLSLKFPTAFRAFLREAGWLQLGSAEIYGLGLDVPEYLDLVRITLSERLEMYPSLPTNLIPFMNDGAGNLYCLPAAAFGRDDPAVLLWNHELGPNQIPEIVASSFADWFWDQLEGAARRR